MPETSPTRLATRTFLIRSRSSRMSGSVTLVSKKKKTKTRAIPGTRKAISSQLSQPSEGPSVA